jgi:hypothetical protein
MSNAEELLDAVAICEAIREPEAVNHIFMPEDSGWDKVHSLDWLHMLSGRFFQNFNKQ